MICDTIVLSCLCSEILYLVYLSYPEVLKYTSIVDSPWVISISIFVDLDFLEVLLGDVSFFVDLDFLLLKLGVAFPMSKSSSINLPSG